MAYQAVVVGALPNDGNGDTIKAAMLKVNDNFDELYAAAWNPAILRAGCFITDSAGINSQVGTTYTLQSSDNGKLIRLNNAGGVTVTIPSGLPVAFFCRLFQEGAGQVVFTTSGTTLRNPSSHTKTSMQYAVVELSSIATNVFSLSGDTAA